MAPDRWKVVRNDAEGRTVFSGTEDDARSYIVNNHPRVHVNHGASAEDEPRPDVHLVNPSGDHTFWNGEWSDSNTVVADPDVFDGEDDE